MTEESPWKQVSSRLVHQTPWFTLTEDEVTTPTGKPGKYTYVTTDGFVVIVARNADGALLLIRQFRYPTARQFWEFPAGLIDAGESLEDAAQRELGEETGLKAGTWRVLGDIYEAVSNSNQRGIVLLADHMSEAEHRRDLADGILKQRWLSLRELNAMAVAGELPDTKTLATLYLLHVHGI